MMKKLVRTTITGTILLFSGLVPSGIEGVASSQPVFGPPVNLGSKINSQWSEGDPFLTAGGKKLFFSDGADLWFSEMTDTGWTNATELGPPINYNIFFQRSPSVSPDGQKLYYVDAERDGTNWDIWVSTWDSSISDWGTPQNLGAPVNTPGVEFSARIAPDGRYLYFTSHYLNLRDGLYVSEWDGSGWSQPTYLGDNVSQTSDEHPSITADGRWLYFDRSVTDGRSTFVSAWTDSGWGQPVDLRSQLVGNTDAPFITPSGDSLFFVGCNDFAGFGGCDIWVSERISTGTEEDIDNRPLPETFELYQNYPNPFNGRTRIKFFVSRSLGNPVNVTIYNILGIPVRRLLREEVINGPREIEWDGTDDDRKEVGTGIYFIQLKVGSNSLVKKAILIR